MKRLDLEKGIIKHFLPLAEQHGFKVFNEDYSGANHIVELRHEVNDVCYYYVVKFIKPNFLKYDSTFAVSSVQVTQLYKQLNPDFEYDEWNFFLFTVNGLLHPKNAGGFFTSNKVEAIIDDITISKEMLAGLSERLYKDYFLPVINKVIPETNSIEKIDKLINDLPDLMDYSKEIRILFYSLSLVDQALAGVLLAKILNRKDYQHLVDRYLDFAKEFPPGDIEEVDLMRKAIELFKSGRLAI